MSGLTAGSVKKKKWSVLGSVTALGKGLDSTADSNASRSRMRRCGRNPCRSSIRVPIHLASDEASLAVESKTTFPLWMYVRTFRSFSDSRSLLSPSIGRMLCPPTLTGLGALGSDRLFLSRALVDLAMFMTYYVSMLLSNTYVRSVRR